ncbi:AbrB family transcriptional regulator [Caulobacter sp. 17J65-9]|uniref:AbrB family transcriptional regulator n=1 Tax=Caulobacter sp. 17J65-9 TaxID=2709382 RepID=UPI0023E45684|nr:AbrB family transcriptional regulator [Caulobacter sp. 17J65-9]
MSRTDAAGFAETIVWAAGGACLLLFLHVPAGALVGAMVGTAAASLIGRPMTAPPKVYAGLLALMGVATGASVTPDALKAAGTWPLSIALLVVATIVLCGAGFLVFRRLGRCDTATAFYASAPGALSAVLALAQADGADMSRVAVAQSLRLLALACVAPFALAGAHTFVPPTPPEGGLTGLAGWGLLIAASALGWLAAARLKWPSAPFLGPMAGSGLVHLTGVVGVAMPHLVVTLAGAGLGALVGTRFRGVSPGALMRFLPVSLAALGVMALVGLSAGWLAGRMTGVGPAAGMLAFAPGSLDVMVAIAVALNANPAYVAAHHTTRFLGLIGALPWLAQKLRPKAA